MNMALAQSGISIQSMSSMIESVSAFCLTYKYEIMNDTECKLHWYY